MSAIARIEAEGSVDLFAMKHLPPATMRGYPAGGDPLAKGSRRDTAVFDRLFHLHPRGGARLQSATGQLGGDAGRYLVDQSVEVDIESQRRPRP